MGNCQRREQRKDVTNLQVTTQIIQITPGGGLGRTEGERLCIQPNRQQTLRLIQGSDLLLEADPWKELTELIRLYHVRQAVQNLLPRRERRGETVKLTNTRLEKALSTAQYYTNQLGRTVNDLDFLRSNWDQYLQGGDLSEKQKKYFRDIERRVDRQLGL